MAKKQGSAASNSKKNNQFNHQRDDIVDSFESARIMRVSPKKVKKETSFLVNLAYTLVAFSALLLAVGIVWRGLQPTSFNQFWQKSINPLLPPVVRQVFK